MLNVDLLSDEVSFYIFHTDNPTLVSFVRSLEMVVSVSQGVFASNILQHMLITLQVVAELTVN